jgi:hypothetical protein
MAERAPDPVAYTERGWFIAPLVHGTKDQHLTEHGFKSASRNPDHVRAWIARHGACNWLLWPAPSGLIVIDWETAAGEATMRQWELWDVPTLRVITARGAHHYFTAPAGPDIETTTLGSGTTIRHRKGYVLLPPSRHPLGHVYRWAGTMADRMPLPASVLARLQTREETAPAPRARSRAGWTVLPQALERRIERYLDALPTGLRDGQGRNPAAYNFAGFLARDLQLADGLALEWLERWNARQAQPLDARELASVLANAHDYGRRAYGSGLERRRAS